MPFKSVILPILFLTGFQVHSQSQKELVFINEKGAFEEETSILVSIQADSREPISFTTETLKIQLSDFSFDSIATIIVEGTFIHTYINQYTPKQFRKLDTIAIYQSRRIVGPTPRVFLKRNYDLDSAILQEGGYLRNFRDEFDMDSIFFLEIHHARPLSKKDKELINRVKTEFCRLAGVEEKTIQLIDKKIPYTTSRFDFFHEGILISEKFIQQQNTPWMKAKAEEYSLVLVTYMIWKK